MTGRPRPHPNPREDDTGRLLATRAVVALLVGRDIDMVRLHCPAVACDVPSRAALVDVDEAHVTLTKLARRRRWN